MLHLTLQGHSDKNKLADLFVVASITRRLIIPYAWSWLYD